VVGLMSCVFDRGINVFTLEEGEVSQNLIVACAIGQEFENVAYTDTPAANAGTPSTLAFFDGDSLESFCAHIEVLTVLTIRLQTGLRQVCLRRLLGLARSGHGELIAAFSKRAAQKE
jgi:hypothetical protein